MDRALCAVPQGKVPGVLAMLACQYRVTSLHMSNGRWDIVAELQADTLGAFEQRVSGIRRLPGIASSQTSTLMSAQKLD